MGQKSDREIGFQSFTPTEWIMNQELNHTTVYFGIVFLFYSIIVIKIFIRKKLVLNTIYKIYIIVTVSYG